MSHRAYVRRIIDRELDDLTAQLPAIALEGPKAVGKTATATERAGSVHGLDDADQLALAQADLDRVLTTTPPVLIDEWQKLPPLWDKVRRAVDRGAAPGQFLLTGSASPRGTGAHSGAGRIVSLRMRPLSLAERLDQPTTVSLAALLADQHHAIEGDTHVSLQEYTEEILRSGFPGLRAYSGRALALQLDSYIDRIVDRDFEELGHSVRKPHALRRWIAAYAAATSTVTSWEKIRDAASSGHDDKLSKAATLPYRDVLERLFVLDDVPAWQPSRNPIRELAAPGKHHLADPALAARLVGATADSLLAGASTGPSVVRDGTQLGALFESLVTLSVRVYAQGCDATVGHLRTHRGLHEVDLIVERRDGRVLALEVKTTEVPMDDDVKHLHWLKQQIGDDLIGMGIVTTGKHAYRREDGVAVIPAALLGP